MGKPHIKWHPIFQEWSCIGRKPRDHTLCFGFGPSPEAAYRDWIFATSFT